MALVHAPRHIGNGHTVHTSGIGNKHTMHAKHEWHPHSGRQALVVHEQCKPHTMRLYQNILEDARTLLNVLDGTKRIKTWLDLSRLL